MTYKKHWLPTGRELVSLEKGEEDFSLTSLLYFLEFYEYVTQSKKLKNKKQKTFFNKNLLCVQKFPNTLNKNTTADP